MVGLICHRTQQLFSLARGGEIRILAEPEDCVVSGNGLGKPCPGDPGYALWPFLQRRLQTPHEVLLNSPERKLFSNPNPGACLPWTCEQVMVKHLRKLRKLKRQCLHVREHVSALFLLNNKYKSLLPRLSILTV